jgi:isoleucyl-tRNA synthetase
VASVEYRNDMPFAKTLLDGLSEWYRKFRNSARFLLSNLIDFDPDADAPLVTRLDRLMARRVDDFLARTRAAYDAYEFHVVHRNLVEFVTTDLSAFYCDVVKDRLYAEAADAPKRRSAQAVLYRALRAITVLASPILSFTTEDIWKHAPRRKGDPDSVHMALLDAGQVWADDDPEHLELEALRALRDRVNSQLEPFRAQKHKSADAKIVLNLPTPPSLPVEDLAELFIVSAVELASSGPEVEVHEHGGLRCERCWKWFQELASDPNDVCPRCAAALPR